MALRRVILGCAGAVMLAGAGAAQADDTFEGFKAETISAIFTAAGGTEMTSELVEGDPRLTFKIGTTIFIVDFYLCEDKVKGCKMMQYAVAFEHDAGDTVEKVNSYNSEFVFGKAALDKKEGLLSLRAIVGTAGSSKRHVLAEFAGFVSATQALLEHMKALTVAAGPGTPAAAALSLSPSPEARTRARWASMRKTKR